MFPPREVPLLLQLGAISPEIGGFDSNCSQREKQRTSTDCAAVNKQDQVESLKMWF